MALGAIALVRNGAALRIAASRALGASILETVWRQSHVLETIRLAPARSHPLNQNVNLLVGKRASSLSRKGRRRSTRQSLRDHLPQRVVAHQSEIERIVQWPRCSQASPGAVTTGAVHGIELGKICYL